MIVVEKHSERFTVQRADRGHKDGEGERHRGLWDIEIVHSRGQVTAVIGHYALRGGELEDARARTVGPLLRRDSYSMNESEVCTAPSTGRHHLPPASPLLGLFVHRSHRVS